MGIWDVVNTLIIVFGIGFWTYVLSNNIIHAVKEEQRKTSEHEAKLMDKILDKLSNRLIETVTKLRSKDEKSAASEKTDNNISWMKK